MLAALGLARRGQGDVWPNPTVGCVLVKDGRVIGRGRTQTGGRPHAETEALAQAGSAARGATAYVTLEPCSHHGKTPPCAQALIDAGVSRVVVSSIDPDDRVSGRGVDMLRAAGLSVDVGLLSEEACEINAGFILHRTQGRPLVTLKLATTLDGRIATANGHSQWITGPAARACGHMLRARHDAVMVGAGTALADDPELTVRLPGMEGRVPVSVVLDGRLSLAPSSKLASAAASRPVWVVTGPKADPAKRKPLENRGVRLIDVGHGHDGRLDIAQVMAALAGLGLTRVMIEGGAALATSFLQCGLVDRLVWFRAPSVIGADGLAGIGALGLDRLEGSPRFRRIATDTIGDDMMETYARI